MAQELENRDLKHTWAHTHTGRHTYTQTHTLADTRTHRRTHWQTHVHTDAHNKWSRHMDFGLNPSLSLYNAFPPPPPPWPIKTRIGHFLFGITCPARNGSTRYCDRYHLMAGVELQSSTKEFIFLGVCTFMDLFYGDIFSFIAPFYRALLITFRDSSTKESIFTGFFFRMDHCYRALFSFLELGQSSYNRFDNFPNAWDGSSAAVYVRDMYACPGGYPFAHEEPSVIVGGDTSHYQLSTHIWNSIFRERKKDGKKDNWFSSTDVRTCLLTLTQRTHKLASPSSVAGYAVRGVK